MRGSLSKKHSSFPFFTGALEPWLLMRFPFSACQKNCVEEEEKEGGRGQMPMGARGGWCSHSLSSSKCSWTRVDNDPSLGENTSL